MTPQEFNKRQVVCDDFADFDGKELFLLSRFVSLTERTTLCKYTNLNGPPPPTHTPPHTYTPALSHILVSIFREENAGSKEDMGLVPKTVCF